MARWSKKSADLGMIREVKRRARSMRIAMTPSEAALWTMLRDRRLAGLKFRRQHRIGRFILDFYCVEHCLAIEVDGLIHQGTLERDANRQAYLESLGVRFFRPSNDDALKRTKAVLERIVALTRGRVYTRARRNPSPAKRERVDSPSGEDG
jgi:very-short-patch-repair endonuclease